MTPKKIDIEKMKKFLEQHSINSALNEKEVTALMQQPEKAQHFERILEELKKTEAADDDVMQQMKQLLDTPEVKEKLL